MVRVVRGPPVPRSLFYVKSVRPRRYSFFSPSAAVRSRIRKTSFSQLQGGHVRPGGQVQRITRILTTGPRLAIRSPTIRSAWFAVSVIPGSARVFISGSIRAAAPPPPAIVAQIQAWRQACSSVHALGTRQGRVVASLPGRPIGPGLSTRTKAAGGPASPATFRDRWAFIYSYVETWPAFQGIPEYSLEYTWPWN